MQTLPAPSCPVGYTAEDLKKILGDDMEKFQNWMVGQTISLCEGRKFNYDTHEYVPTECSAHPHGAVVYPWDLRQFLAHKPPLD